MDADIWGEIREELLNIEESGAYYAGATLCVPFGLKCEEAEAFWRREICLNLDGTSILLGGHLPYCGKKLEQPKDIAQLVRIIYLAYRVYKNEIIRPH
ncbi:MAG: hypothetical protein GF334_07505 [Candidatus Altiarchaeales archaeon]|nr:hypothetical protein [Candidatus Altiarchaeales archaeon]